MKFIVITTRKNLIKLKKGKQMSLIKFLRIFNNTQDFYSRL